MNYPWIHSFVFLLFLSLLSPMLTRQEGWQAGRGCLLSPQFSSPRLREPWYLHAAHGWKWDTWLRRNRTGTLWFLLKASASGCTLDAGAEEMAFKWWQIIRRTIKMKPSNSTVQISFPVPFWALAESFKERKESITLPWLQGEAHPSAHFCSLSWCLCQHQPGLWAESVSVCGVRCST